MFLSSAHGTFSTINSMLAHKTSLNKFKKTKIISSIFSSHNSIKLEINYRKKKKKNLEKTQMCGDGKNMLLNNRFVNEKIKDNIKKYMETNENKTTMVLNL